MTDYAIMVEPLSHADGGSCLRPSRVQGYMTGVKRAAEPAVKREIHLLAAP